MTERRWDQSCTWERGHKAVLVWCCRNKKDADNALVWLAANTHDGAKRLARWRRMARVSGALTISSNYHVTYRESKHRYDACMVLFLAKRYCTDEAIAHEAFHAVVALWWRLFRRMAKSGDRHDTNEAIALRIGRLVKRLHQFRAQFYGGKP